ncbi:MAG TPA: trypsin-like peptidase domain-containing protein [Capillimicrobium sp.]|nr:trypsin-like peptidase domain-containing protein [Capillimicrobium sp.]
MRKLIVPTLSGLFGGVVVAVLVLALGLGGGETTTTVVRQAPVSSQAASDGQGLTARDIYKRDAPGVVFIRSQVVQQAQSPFGFPQQQQGEATGSGFVIDEAGNILTNAHVVDGAVKVTVQFDDNRTVDAKVVGTDTSSDLALLHVDPDGLDLHPLELGSAKEVSVGDPVLAIGNPFGLDRTLTTGVVSALQREIQAPNGFTIRNVIQTDAAINPGNSGGPLLDAAGRVIGINSQIATGGGGDGNVGIGFAVPIDTARQELAALKSGEAIKRPYMGVSTLTIDGSLAGLGLPVKQGALVQSVEQGSPADKAGLHAGGITAQLATGETVTLGGDIIVEIDGKPVSTSDDVATIVAQHEPGDTVQVTYLRDGERHTTDVTLGNRPDHQQQG